MSIQNGKKPLSAKPAAKRPLNLEDIFGNTLAVPADIQKALESKGMSSRWIVYKKYADMGGSHERGWRPIKRKECGIMDASLEGDAEGYIRRGDLVLAVRPNDVNELHKAYLKQEASRSSNVQKTHADELRSFVEASGSNIKITEGYGEE